MTNHPSLAQLYDHCDVMDRWDFFARDPGNMHFRALPVLHNSDVAKIAGMGQMTAVAQPTLADFAEVRLHAFRHMVGGSIRTMVGCPRSPSSLEWQYCDCRWQHAFIEPVASLFAVRNYSIEVDGNTSSSVLHLYG